MRGQPMPAGVHFPHMRFLSAGLLCLLLGLSSVASGQVDANSFVESIGFNRSYRPDGWVPMVVNLKSTLGEPADYRIQVVQPDIDGDKVIYERLVTLNANATEKYWVYFRPQPSGIDAPTVADLQKVLQVRLCGKDGKQLLLLRHTNTLSDFDPKSTAFQAKRGKKMVLAVTAGTATPNWTDYDFAIGQVEDVEMLKVTPAELPESAIGLDAVDSIVWLDADAAEMTRAGSRKLAALLEWVRQGGQLVVCQPDEVFRISAFAEVLPVHLFAPDGKQVVEIVSRQTPEPLRRIAMSRNEGQLDPNKRVQDQWGTMPGPFRVARAPLKNDALIDEWVDWTAGEGGGRTPYIARNAVGLGSVTWVAQDLGDRVITSNKSSGWPYVWDRVFGWSNATVVIKSTDQAKRNEIWGTEIEKWAATATADLGGTFLRATDHPGKAGTYVFLVILFFIGYWIVAGPGSYLFLAGKGQRHLSWAIFSVSALAATLLTVGVVKLVLRGEPEARHVSVVRAAPGLPSVADGRIGLYIPRDGRQKVELKGVAPDAASYITPLGIHPQHLINPTTFSDTLEYTVPVHEVTGEQPVVVEFPYRSTLKKIQAHWVGTLQEGIDGWAGLVEPQSIDVNVEGKTVKSGMLEGKLTNRTGHDLKHVFLAFRFQAAQDPGERPLESEWLVYVPGLKKDQTLDLLQTMAVPTLINDQTYDKFVQGLAQAPIRGLLSSWGSNLLHYMKNVIRSENFIDDSDRPVSQSVLIMTLFDRIQPVPNEKFGFTRADLLRRGGRDLNLSQALAAGNLVVLAQADDVPVPFPMEVNGERLGGQGRVYYQASIPIKNRSKMIEAAFKDAPAASQPSQPPTNNRQAPTDPRSAQ